MWSRLMSWGKKALRVGQSNPKETPFSAAISCTCQICTEPDRSSAASAAIRMVVALVVAIRIFLRSSRSASAPPNRLIRMAGMAVAAPSTPRSLALPPSSCTISQPWPTMTSCIPPTAASDPSQNLR
jgi:hypothetical protein